MYNFNSICKMFKSIASYPSRINLSFTVSKNNIECILSFWVECCWVGESGSYISLKSQGPKQWKSELAVFWKQYGLLATSRGFGIELRAFESCSSMYFLGKLFNFAVLQFPDIKMEVMIVPATGLFWRVNEMMHVKWLEERLGYSHSININWLLWRRDC